MTQQMKHPSIGAHHISFFGLDDYGTHEQSQSSWGGGETYQTDDYSQYPQHQDSMEDTIFNDGCWHSYQCFFGDSDTESDEEWNQSNEQYYEAEAYGKSLLPENSTPSVMLISSALRNEYLVHKQRYRSYGQRPTKYKRFNTRFDRKGKTRKGGKFKKRGEPSYFKGKSGKPRPTFLDEGAAQWGPYEEQHGSHDYNDSSSTYFGGKGGKRKGNPKSPDGRVMQCHECGSEDHLRRDCPKGKGGSKAPAQATMHTNASPMMSLGNMYNTPQMMPGQRFFVETEDSNVVMQQPSTWTSTHDRMELDGEWNLQVSGRWFQSSGDLGSTTSSPWPGDPWQARLHGAMMSRTVERSSILQQAYRAVPTFSSSRVQIEELPMASGQQAILAQVTPATSSTPAPSRSMLEMAGAAHGSRGFFPWWSDALSNADLEVAERETFLIRTKIEGQYREGLLVDPGAHDNLIGNLTAKRFIVCIERAGLGHLVKWTQLKKPIPVSGVGNGAPVCEWQVELPIVLEKNGIQSMSTFSAPVVGNDHAPSSVPALWGVKSQVKHRTIVDLVNNQIHLCGPGKVHIDAPAGSVCIAMEAAVSGHMLVPCTNYQNVDDRKPGISFQVESNIE